jgi:DNA polymerase IV
MSRRQLHRGPTGSWGDDDTDCTILHVDMDAFYASVEVARRPELRGRPVIVGHDGGRGVVLSATYEARALGVHSAMPMSRARRAAPHAVIVEPDHEQYSAASAAIMAVFRSITPIVEPLSLDEAFLDVAGARRLLGRPTAIADRIRARVHDEQGITCSVGVASTKFLAKLASTAAKPDGMLVVPPDRAVAFLHPLPVGALWGVGDKTEQILARLGLNTVGDVAGTPVSTLQRALGDSLATHLSALSWGHDPRRVVPDEPERSIGAEETFGRDVDDPEVIRRELLRLSERVGRRLRQAELVGRTISLKVRFADFTTITRSRTLGDPTDVAHEIYGVVSGLFDALHLQRARLRLVGVRVEGLRTARQSSRQLLMDPPDRDWRDAERAVDAVAARFGAQAVRPARLVAGPDDQE